MMDSSPLLSRSDSVEPPKHIPSLDETIERFLGSFGWAQLIEAVIVSFAWVFDAQQTFISVFTDSAPSWHCTQLGDGSCRNSSMENQCTIPRSGWAWDEPRRSSIVSEWDLACASPFITGLPTSSFFIGCLIGGLVLATLADSSLGRKNMLVIACLTMSLTGVLTVFSPNIYVYSSLRFISGFGRATIGTCALVLSSELVGKRWRGEVGIIGFFCFTIGFLSLPCIAYFASSSSSYSWRTLYLWTSIPTIGYCLLVHFLVHESPRWLLTQGRKEEALETLRSMASSTSSSTKMLISLPDELGAGAAQEESWISRMKMLWEKKWAFRRLIAVMTVGFGIGMVYYGMPLGLNNLAFHNLYLSVTFNALSELPASLITFCLIGRINRRSAILVFSLASGVSSIMCVIVANTGMKLFQIGMELVSFFSACTAFNVLLIYSLELFPTCVRNSALSMVRQALVFGGVFSPVLVAAAGREDGRLFLSYGVFGVVIGCCGLFVVCLPETKGGAFCDTMDEQEDCKSSSIGGVRGRMLNS